MLSRFSRFPIRFIIGGVVLIILMGGIGFAYFLFEGSRGEDVGIEISKPEQVLMGEPFDISLTVSNYSDKVIGNARISLAVPEDISFVGQSSGQRIFEQLLGDLGPGSLSQRSFTVIALGGAQSLARVEATLHYASKENPRLQYEERRDIDVEVGQPAIALLLSTPERVFSGETFEVEVSYENRSGNDVKNAVLALDYPPIFQFEKSTAPPDKGTNTWNIPLLHRGEKVTFTISGTVVAPDQSFFSINGSVRADFLGETYALASQSANIAVAASPLSLRITVNEKDSYIAKLGDRLGYTLTYRNNANTPMEHVVIKATLQGELLEYQSVEAEAAFDSLANTITWNAATTPALLSVFPGQEGSVNFSIQTKNAFTLTRRSDKNYVLKLKGQIESPTVPQGTAAAKTVSVATLDTKVAGDLRLETRVYFRDAASGILNTGPYPPRVNQKTQYTVHWKLMNYATDVSGVRVSAFLQSGTRMTSNVKSTITPQPTYNPASGEVVWDVGSLAATRGVVGTPIEAIFQIENTPAINQLGREVSLIGETRLAAHDDFVDFPIVGVNPSVTTDLPDDTTLGSVNGDVVE